LGKTRLFFVTDVHGSDRCFRKFLNAHKFYNANVLILGGDITGKAMIPIVSASDGTYECGYAGENLRFHSRDEAQQIAKEISDYGAYPHFVERKEYEELNSNPELVKKTFNKLMVESVERWMRLAEERLKGTGVKCYISPGNDDILEIDDALSSSSVVVNPEEKVVNIDDKHEMITLGTVNHTPWNSPRELDEDVLEQKINRLADQVRDMDNAIFNLHVPPIDTPIDQAPKVSADLKPVVTAGQVVMISAGSAATRHAIEKYQPLMGIHGHIHESRGLVKIGRTMCFNPGSEYGEGILRGFLCQLDDKKLDSYLLTSG
jgi:uncharacterized protein